MIDGGPRPPGRGQGRRRAGRRRRRLAGVRRAEQRLLRLRRAAARRLRRGHAVGRRVDRPGRGRPSASASASAASTAPRPTDPHPQVISVRQRRDYRVPSVAALLRVAEAARRERHPGRRRAGPGRGRRRGRAGAAAGRRRLARRARRPRAGAARRRGHRREVATPLDLEAFDDDDGAGPFQPAADDRLVGRLDEHPFLELDEDHDHAGHQH